MEIKERNQSIDLVKIIAMMGVMALHTCIGRTDTKLNQDMTDINRVVPRH